MTHLAYIYQWPGTEIRAIYILQYNGGQYYCYIPVLRFPTSRLYIVIRTHVFKRNIFIPFNLF
jgi:hypothetical protein